MIPAPEIEGFAAIFGLLPQFIDGRDQCALAGEPPNVIRNWEAISRR